MPQDFRACNQLAIGEGTITAQQLQMEATLIYKNNSHEVHLGVVEGTKGLTIYTVGEDALTPLQKKYIE